MRFFSSSAFASAEKLRLAANCSAAETITRLRCRPHHPGRSALYGHQPVASLVAGAGARIFTDPPAFSTAATADFDAPNTSNATLVLISPAPRSRTPSFARRRIPALTNTSTVTGAPILSFPASIAACTRPRLTSLSLRANGEFLKPRFGSRRCSGICPPSKPLIRTPERAVWPLPPRPPVLPLPEPIPRPMRKRLRRAPSLSARSDSFIARSPHSSGSRLPVDDAHEMLDLADHAPRLRRVQKLGNAADAVEPQADQRLPLSMDAADRTADLLHLDGLCCLAHVIPPAWRANLIRSPARHRYRAAAPAA